MEVKTYVPRIRRVAAVRLSAENIGDVARWCEARIAQPGNPGLSGASIQLPNGEEADSGDWIVMEMRKYWPTSAKSAPHFYVVHNAEFERLWEEAIQ